MLYWLLFQVLHKYVPVFRIFGYITVRTGFGQFFGARHRLDSRDRGSFVNCAN